MQAVDFAMQMDIDKLGNVPDILRAMADAYQRRLEADTHMQIKDVPMDVTYVAVPETVMRGRMTIINRDVTEIGLVDVPPRVRP